MRRNANLIAGIAFVLAGAIPASPVVADDTRRTCLSPFDCMAAALDDHWTALGDGLEIASEQRRQALELLVKAKARGLPDPTLQKLAANAAAIDRAWQQAKALAMVAVSPEMRAHHESRAAQANERFAEGRRQLAREAELLARMEHNAFGPSWKGIVGECVDLAHESDARRIAAIGQVTDAARMFITAGIAGPIAKRYLPKADDQEKIRRFAAANDLFYAAFATPLRTGHAYHDKRPSDALIEAASGIVEMGAGFVGSLGNEVAGAATVGNHIFQIGLHAFVFRNVGQRLRETEALAARLEAAEAPWRARIAASQENLRHLTRERDLAARQLAGQQALAERVERLLREARP